MHGFPDSNLRVAHRGDFEPGDPRGVCAHPRPRPGPPPDPRPPPPNPGAVTVAQGCASNGSSRWPHRVASGQGNAKQILRGDGSRTGCFQKSVTTRFPNNQHHLHPPLCLREEGWGRPSSGRAPGVLPYQSLNSIYTTPAGGSSAGQAPRAAVLGTPPYKFQKSIHQELTPRLATPTILLRTWFHTHPTPAT